MNDPAIMPGLMPGRFGFLFDKGQVESRAGPAQGHGGGQTHNAAPHDQNIERIGHPHFLMVKSKERRVTP